MISDNWLQKSNSDHFCPYSKQVMSKKRLDSGINFYCKNLHSVCCASLDSKLEVTLLPILFLMQYAWKIDIRDHSRTTWTKFYTHTPLELTRMDIFYTFYTLSCDPSRVLSTDPSPPLLVHVFIECPLTSGRFLLS